MFAEERPHLLPLPVEPFRFYRHGTRTVHLDGAVEVEGAYYHLPPGWLGRRVAVQWDALHVRILDPATGALVREHVRHGARPADAMRDEDRPRRTPPTTWRCSRARLAPARTSARSAERHPPPRRRGRRAPHPRACSPSRSKHGAARVEAACAAALELGVPTYGFVEALPRAPPRRGSPAHADRSPDPPAHPLPRRHRASHRRRRVRMNLVELDHALRKLRLSGMAATLETRLARSAERSPRPARPRLDARPRRAHAAPGSAPRPPHQGRALPRSRRLRSIASTSTSTRR